MKSLIAFFIFFITFNNFCYADGAPVSDLTAVEAISATSDPAEEQTVVINPNLKIIAKSQQEQNDEFAYTIEANYPQLVSANLTPAEQRFNQEILNNVTQQIEKFKNYVKADHNHMLTLPESLRSNNFNLDYDVDVLTPDDRIIISVRLNTEGMQAGRAHPYHTHQTINFDLKNNKILALNDLFKPRTNYLNVLSQIANKKLMGTLADKWMIKDGSAPTVQNFKNWNLEADGILITFEEYQVAPYAAGAQEVEIPFSALKNILAAHSPLMSCAKDTYNCINDANVTPAKTGI